VSGAKIGFRSQDEEHLLSADCLPLTADCRLPTAYRRLPTALEGGGMERALGRHGSPGQDVTAEWERKNGSSAEFVGEKTAKERRSIEPETRCGNDAPWKPWKGPKARATFPPFPPRLGIPQKARDFHIPTATTAGSHSSKLPPGSSQQARASGGIRDLLVP